MQGARTCHTSHYSITSPRREVADWIFGEPDSEVDNLDLDVNRADLEVNRADLEVNKADLEVNIADLDVNRADLEVNRADLDVNRADLVEVDGAHRVEPEEVGGGPLGTSKD